MIFNIRLMIKSDVNIRVVFFCNYTYIFYCIEVAILV